MLGRSWATLSTGGKLNHYQTLGVLQSAEAIVIKAAYRALTSIYHPDKNKDPDASSRMQKINAAYAVLSDTQKKLAYDSSLKLSDAKVDASDFESKNPFKEDPLLESWEIALRFNPEIDGYCKHLEELSWMLGFSYKVQLLETQDFNNAANIAQGLRLQYLSKYFGKNTYIIDYAEKYILAKKIDAALYLNKIIVVMGASVTLHQLELEMERQHPDSVNPNSATTINEFELYSKIVTLTNEYDSDSAFYSAIKLFEINGGVVVVRFWGKVESIIYGEKVVHSNKYEFRKFVLNMYMKNYT